LDAGAELTNRGHLAADVAARDVGKRYLDTGEPLAEPEVQVVQGARLNPHQDLVRGDLGVGDLLQLQNLASPMRVKANCLHRELSVKGPGRKLKGLDTCPPGGDAVILDLEVLKLLVVRFDLLMAEGHFPPEGDDGLSDGPRLFDNPEPLPALPGEAQLFQKGHQPYIVPLLDKLLYFPKLCSGEPFGEQALQFMHPVRSVQ
jgi:hypothetical protein